MAAAGAASRRHSPQMCWEEKTSSWLSASLPIFLRLAVLPVSVLAHPTHCLSLGSSLASHEWHGGPLGDCLLITIPSSSPEVWSPKH